MLQSLRQILRRVPRLFERKFGNNEVNYNLNKSQKFCLFAPLGLVVHAAEVNQLKPPNPQDLTSSYLIKNASIATVDAGTALLTQITCSLLDAYQQYHLALVEIIKLLELNLTVIGDANKEDALWDVVLQIRSDDLEAAFCCAERSLEAAAEAAHIAGSTYAGMAASERLFSAKARLREARDKAEETEGELRKLEVETIQKTTEKKKEEKIIHKEDLEEDLEPVPDNNFVEEDISQDEN